MRSPLRWMGGKSRLAERIIPLLPAHAAYVETCCGGASVFWAKRPSKAEILNDADGELINFYYMLRKAGRRLARELDAMPYSRALFARVLESSPRTAFGRALRFWYLNRVAFGAKRAGSSFGVRASGRVAVLTAEIAGNLDALIERLCGVLFEAVDVVRLIRLYDRPDTLFYVDPPYLGLTQSYACQFRPEDHARLATALLDIRGAFLLSYNDCPEVRRLYAGCHALPLSTRYTIGCNSSTGGSTAAPELLISNRPLASAEPGVRTVATGT